MYILTLNGEIIFVNKTKKKTTAKRKQYQHAGIKVVQWQTPRPVKVGELFQ